MTETQTVIAALEAKYPAWQVWVVNGWDGTKDARRWCARLWADEKVVKNAWEPEHLAEYIEEHQAERPGKWT